MGNYQSNTNISEMAQNVNISSNQNCGASQLTSIVNSAVVIEGAQCKVLNVNSSDVGQQITCDQDQYVSVISKMIADQKAANSAAFSFLDVLLPNNQSNTNIVNQQTNIEMALQATCGAQQNTSVQNKSVIMRDISGDECNINATNVHQSFACSQDFSAQLDLEQTSTQSAENSFVGLLSILLIVAAVMVGLVLIARALRKGGGVAVDSPATQILKLKSRLAKLNAVTSALPAAGAAAATVASGVGAAAALAKAVKG